MRAALVLPASDSQEQPCRSCRLRLGDAEGWGCASPLAFCVACSASAAALGLAAGRMCCPASWARQKQGAGRGFALVSAVSPRLICRGDTYADRQAASGRPPWTHPAVLVPGRAMRRVSWLGVHRVPASGQRWGLRPAAVPLPRPSGQGLDSGQGGLAAHGRSRQTEGGSGPRGGRRSRARGRRQGRASEAAMLLSGGCGEARLHGSGPERRKLPLRGSGEPPPLPTAPHCRGTTALGAASGAFRGRGSELGSRVRQALHGERAWV